MSMASGTVASGTRMSSRRIYVGARVPMRVIGASLQQFEGAASGNFEINTSCVNSPFDTEYQTSCYYDIDFQASNTGGNAKETMTIFAQPSFWDGSVRWNAEEGTVELYATIIGVNGATTAINTDLTSPP